MRRQRISEERQREAICATARTIWERGLGAAGDGNLSVRLGGDLVLTTPSASHKGKLQPQDLVVVDLDGRVRGAGRPSSELVLHLAAYRGRPDVGAVIHAHPPHAVALQMAGVPLSELYVSELIFAFGQPATAPYTTPTTTDVGRVLGAYLRCHDVVLMPRHGSVSVGPDLDTAFLRLDALEHSARIALLARSVGQPTPIPQDEIRNLYQVAGKTPVGAGCPPYEPEDRATAATEGSDEALIAAVLQALGPRGRP
ncbi:MAG: class II aldolase/adducin family protein [Deltaproteobacteria bacterium]|nr:class II aldolase/adducin family protein [Deltaproteobacteria bacterium]